jgi:hypothetical protein
MKFVYRIDKDGYYIEPVILKENDNIPSDCIETRPQDGFYKPQFVNNEWTEGETQEEIDAIKNAPQPLSELEQLKKQQELMQSALDDLILGGAL